MADAILSFTRDLMSSGWIYPLILGIAALDAFLPAVPSETLVVSAGVFAALGSPDLYAVIAVAALGAFAGDHVSWAIGRFAGSRIVHRLRPGTKRHALHQWATRALSERGGLVLVVARYIPGGRTAVTMTMGAVRYPLRSFSAYAGLAAVCWATYCTLVGYLGGKAFEDNPLKGVALGIGLALAVTLTVELVRHRRRRGRVAAAPDDASGAIADDAEAEAAAEVMAGRRV